MEDGMAKDRADRDGVDRRHALECMVWAGTGVLWTLSGGVPRALGLVGDAAAAEGVASAFTFLKFSDSHVGFDKPAEPAKRTLGALSTPKQTGLRPGQAFSNTRWGGRQAAQRGQCRRRAIYGRHR